MHFPHSAKAQSRRGAHVVEMAIILPVFLAMLIGIIDFARATYAYTAVVESARCGARHAMVNGATSTTVVGPTANNTTVEAVVKNNAKGLDTSLLSVASTWPNGTNTTGSPVTVTATYNFKLVVADLVGLQPITIRGTSTMMITH